MKKNFVRIIAALLVAMLALTLLPLSTFALEPQDIVVGGVYFDEEDPEYNDAIHFDYDYPLISSDPDDSIEIKIDDYDELVELWGDLYDMDGLIFGPGDDMGATIEPDDEITIPAYDGTDEWLAKYGWIYLAYTPHHHKLSRWYSDGTTHWRECLVCKKDKRFHEKFMYQNWCQDGDEDGICNVCGGDVPYHDVTVIEEEGGKITVNRDNASHRMKITADVEPAEGYKLKKLHFVKIRDDGSRQEITRHKKNGQFWTLMPTYELEVSAEFVKK